MTTEMTLPPAMTGERLGRKAVVWGMGHGLIALVWAVYGLAGGGPVSWWLISGLITAVGGGILYIIAGRDLKAGDPAGRGRLIMASVVALNWLALISALALFGSVMHPDVIVGDGVLTILVGFLLPLLHLVGNFWMMINAINLGTGEWRPE